MDSSPPKNFVPKKLLLAISGSIAAYKAADIVSSLRQKGHQVQCILTENAKQFVAPLVLETLSGRTAPSALFGPGVSGTEHIRLARFADLMVFAPATANLISKLALGLADDLVTTVALATEAPWLIAPAMNTAMWNKPIIQSHIQTLQKQGAVIVEPEAGLLACGEDGPGKLASSDSIVNTILETLQSQSLQSPGKQNLAGLTVLITAGPTISRIDAVRYMTNPSTGRMGAALAEVALHRGAAVRYILGVDKGVVRPSPPKHAEHRLKIIEVETAEEMLEASLKELPDVNGVIAAAAVLDYQTEHSARDKLKRTKERVQLMLNPSVDVLSELKAHARDGQWFFGFAAETDSDNIENLGREKFTKKRLDFLFANKIEKAGRLSQTGFGAETNGGLLFYRGSINPLTIPVQSKLALAETLWDKIEEAGACS